MSRPCDFDVMLEIKDEEKSAVKVAKLPLKMHVYPLLSNAILKSNNSL
jgi:hypothetical protein